MRENICAFPHILGSPSSYMTLHPIPSEFPYLWGKFWFIFHQCRNTYMLGFVAGNQWRYVDCSTLYIVQFFNCWQCSKTAYETLVRKRCTFNKVLDTELSLKLRFSFMDLLCTMSVTMANSTIFHTLKFSFILLFMHKEPGSKNNNGSGPPKFAVFPAIQEI